jgi:hypothetical protein
VDYVITYNMSCSLYLSHQLKFDVSPLRLNLETNLHNYTFTFIPKTYLTKILLLNISQELIIKHNYHSLYNLVFSPYIYKK